MWANESDVVLGILRNVIIIVGSALVTCVHCSLYIWNSKCLLFVQLYPRKVFYWFPGHHFNVLLAKILTNIIAEHFAESKINFMRPTVAVNFDHFKGIWRAFALHVMISKLKLKFIGNDAEFGSHPHWLDNSVFCFYFSVNFLICHDGNQSIIIIIHRCRVFPSKK